jgi:hypothetical protein
MQKSNHLKQTVAAPFAAATESWQLTVGRLHRLRGAALALVCLGWLVTAAAEEAAEEPGPPQPYRVFIEPAAFARPASVPLETARSTVFTPMREQDGRFTPWDKDDFERLRIGPGPFLQRAAQVAGEDLKRVRSRRMRDPLNAGGGEYVLLTSDEPIVAALILSPFLRRWLEPALGPDQWLVAPDQYTLYVFTAESAIIRTLGPEIATRYENAVWPASLEVFEWKPDATKPRAIASLSEGQ